MFKKLLVFTFFLFLIFSNVYAMDSDRNEGINPDCTVFLREIKGVQVVKVGLANSF